jgi:hypothetical protein
MEIIRMANVPLMTNCRNKALIKTKESKSYLTDLAHEGKSTKSLSKQPADSATESEGEQLNGTCLPSPEWSPVADHHKWQHREDGLSFARQQSLASGT